MIGFIVNLVYIVFIVFIVLWFYCILYSDITDYHNSHRGATGHVGGLFLFLMFFVAAAAGYNPRVNYSVNNSRSKRDSRPPLFVWQSPNLAATPSGCPPQPRPILSTPQIQLPQSFNHEIVEGGQGTEEGQWANDNDNDADDNNDNDNDDDSNDNENDDNNDNGNDDDNNDNDNDADDNNDHDNNSNGYNNDGNGDDCNNSGNGGGGDGDCDDSSSRR